MKLIQKSIISRRFGVILTPSSGIFQKSDFKNQVYLNKIYINKYIVLSI